MKICVPNDLDTINNYTWLLSDAYHYLEAIREGTLEDGEWRDIDSWLDEYRNLVLKIKVVS